MIDDARNHEREEEIFSLVNIRHHKKLERLYKITESNFEIM
jgi:hypothetical protein